MNNLMNVKKLKDEFEQYNRSYKLLVERNDQLEKRYAEQENKITVLINSLENCQKAFDTNKTLLRQMAAEHNKKEQSLIEYMNKLKAKLRELGYANFNKLGNEGD
jgi:predicted  nucleic acid-binding Zn-ribbon protein